MSDILENPAVIAELKVHAPRSELTGLAFNLVDCIWQNSSDPQWWTDESGYGLFPYRIQKRLQSDEIEVAAVAAGLDQDIVKIACAAWEAELQAAGRRLFEQIKAQQKAEAENRLEAIRLLIKQIEKQRLCDSNPNYGTRKQKRLEAALEGNDQMLSPYDHAEINSIAKKL